jgi:uncharacterized protein HemY
MRGLLVLAVVFALGVFLGPWVMGIFGKRAS